MCDFPCASHFIQKLHRNQLKLLPIPPEIKAYVTKLYSLHHSPAQLLSDPSAWVSAWQTTSRLAFKLRMEYYDENDPDLMIEPIDDKKYRETWAVCFEAYLRRQLIILYNTPEMRYNHNESIFLKSVSLPLPAINPFSSTPDDIRMHQVKIKKFMLHGSDRTLYELLHGQSTSHTLYPSARFGTPPEYSHLTWHTRQGPNNQPPIFRCRPALLNSMDCMTLLHDNMEFPSEKIMTKVAYYLRPFRFVLPLFFMFDIFGGYDNDPTIETYFPEEGNKKNFPDAKVTQLTVNSL